jgi:hypothetical protein
MSLMTRLKRLEKEFGIDRGDVYFVEQNTDENRLEIPKLDFQGTIESGYELMKRYPNSVFIIDDIPRWG